MNDYKIFTEYQDKIINSSDIEEACSILNIALVLTDNETEKQLLKSLIHPDRFNKEMDFNKFKIYLDIIDFIYYQNDASLIMEDIELNYNDSTQINTLKKIIRNKPMKSSNHGKKIIINYKNCPHCGLKNIGKSDTTYIICGYSSNKGFDWKGCGHDWCFSCGKKLCKTWTNNMLFNPQNRFHDEKCCKHYAQSIGDQYPDNYCICQCNKRV